MQKLVFHRKLEPRKLLDLDFVITVDRCMMSNYHGREFLGFLSTAPPVLLPEKLWIWLACPRMKVDEYGRPWQAPYGLRKIEAALQEAGFKAAIIDPDYIWPYLRRAKALLIGHHDFFGLGHPSTEWWWLTGREPANRRSFIEFISQPEIWEAHRRGLKIVVGGPAAWQWSVEPGALEKWPVDVIVEGEADEVIVKIAEAILEGGELPRRIEVSPRDSPSLEKIPAIKAPSVNGLVEIMRGCPRGCQFCSVTARPLRHIPLPRILEEVRVNLEAGVRQIILHSEDVPLYGAYGVIPNPEKLTRLHKEVLKVKQEYEERVGEGIGFSWSHSSLSSILVMEERFRLFSKLSEMVVDGDTVKFIAFQTGIETGSPRLAKRIMPGKSAPYPPEKWPEVVEEAFRILADNNGFPAATIILGIPGETTDDLVATAELIERLKPYPSLIVPLFFVPLGRLKNHDWFRREDVTDYHLEVMRLAYHHTIRWAWWVAGKYVSNPAVALPLKLFMALTRVAVAILEKRLGLTHHELLHHTARHNAAVAA
ncbi:Radical SAM domain protein [Pyrolobus fumarii 1A]|uniref:Radical SAM domain protein n=1 Tax=Pyrolobus fumarii (strain DSM 11204 / 1A) TaxID=694429 RepID=G0ECS9_PYRF1|nr:radical SAM protein [Pyrolobus fumarii]AEM39649.1 Radical SAM domain protein [Pyrolobus fumarii 1A]